MSTHLRHRPLRCRRSRCHCPPPAASSPQRLTPAAGCAAACSARHVVGGRKAACLVRARQQRPLTTSVLQPASTDHRRPGSKAVQQQPLTEGGSSAAASSSLLPARSTKSLSSPAGGARGQAKWAGRAGCEDGAHARLWAAARALPRHRHRRLLGRAQPAPADPRRVSPDASAAAARRCLAVEPPLAAGLAAAALPADLGAAAGACCCCEAPAALPRKASRVAWPLAPRAASGSSSSSLLPARSLQGWHVWVWVVCGSGSCSRRAESAAELAGRLRGTAAATQATPVTAAAPVPAVATATPTMLSCTAAARPAQQRCGAHGVRFRLLLGLRRALCTPLLAASALQLARRALLRLAVLCAATRGMQ